MFDFIDSICCNPKFYKCYVCPILLNGVETWTASQVSKKRLEVFAMWAMRRLMRIERISNERVMMLAGVRRELMKLI